MKFLKKLGSFFIKKDQLVESIKPEVKPVKKQSTGRLAGFIGVLLLTIFSALVLTLSIRGHAGNPTPSELNTNHWKDNGPLELSPERGRYALMYSLVENNSYTFSQPIAAFAAPDVAYMNGKYVSLFAPGVSYLTIPGYLAGKNFGLAQIGAFAVIGLFAIFNFLLIRAIAIRLGATGIAASVGAMAFLFASPAFSYAVTLYQHHVSTFLILASILLLIKYRSVLSLIAIWLMCGASIAVDYPNFFMMLPIGLYALARTFPVQRQAFVTKISVPFMKVFAIAAIAIPLAFFLAFNNASYGNPLTLSGSVERAIEVKPNGKPVLEAEVMKKQLEKSGQKNAKVEDKNISSFFNPRDMINGLYTHTLSADRGTLLYTPVMLFGLIGMFLARGYRKYMALMAGVLGFNVVLYSMWGDPYGGWAFGSRYLIPTYAMLAVFIGVMLTKWNKQLIFLILFFLMFSYSVGVNTIGAITSNRNPPKVEAQALENISGQKEEYTYARNMHMLDNNNSKSFIFQTYAKEYLSAWNYLYVLTGGIILTGGALLTYQTAKALGPEKAQVKNVSRLPVGRKEHYAI